MLYTKSAMKVYLTLLIFFINLNIFANTTPKLEKEININFNNEFKIVNTYSGNLDKHNSLHLIIGKTKVKAYQANNENFLSAKTFSIPSKATIIGHHSNNKIISLIISFTKESENYIKIYDIDFNNNVVISSKAHKNSNQIIIASASDRTFILNCDEKSLSSREILSSSKINLTRIKFDNQPEYYKLFKKNYHYKFISQKQYIPTGPFSYAHTYLDDNNNFIFILDYKRTFTFGKINPKALNDVSVFKLDEYPKKVEGHTIKFNSKYYHDNNIYFYYGSSQSSELKIINVDSHKIIKNITLLPDNNFVHQEGDNTDYTFKKYLRKVQAGTKEACLTVNELADNNGISIRFDYVQDENNLYYYHYYMRYNHNINGFTPSFGRPSTYLNYNDLTSKKEAFKDRNPKTYHHITLDDNFNFTNPKELKFKKLNMDKLYYVETIKKGYLKFSSYTFLDSKCRYFSFDNKSKKILLKYFK